MRPGAVRRCPAARAAREYAVKRADNLARGGPASGVSNYCGVRRGGAAGNCTERWTTWRQATSSADRPGRCGLETTICRELPPRGPAWCKPASSAVGAQRGEGDDTTGGKRSFGETGRGWRPSRVVMDVSHAGDLAAGKWAGRAAATVIALRRHPGRRPGPIRDSSAGRRRDLAQTRAPPSGLPRLSPRMTGVRRGPCVYPHPLSHVTDPTYIEGQTSYAPVLYIYIYK